MKLSISTSRRVVKQFHDADYGVRVSGGTVPAIVVEAQDGSYLAIERESAIKLGQAILDHANQLPKPKPPGQVKVTYASSFGYAKSVVGHSFFIDKDTFSLDLSDGTTLSRPASRFISVQKA